MGMQTHITKVAIIGAGAVGATVAFSLVVKGVAAEIALVDLKKEKAMGEMLGCGYCDHYGSGAL